MQSRMKDVAGGLKALAGIGTRPATHAAGRGSSSYGMFELRMSPLFPPRSADAFFHSCCISV